MKVTGIVLRNFRSIGNESVSLNPLRKCNILIGRNNSGKSNTIKSVAKIMSGIRAMQDASFLRNNPQILINLDHHRGSLQTPFRFDLHFELVDPELIRITQTNQAWFAFSWKADQKVPDIVDFSFARFKFPIAASLFQHVTPREFRGQPSPEVIFQEFMQHRFHIFNNRFVNELPEVHIVPEFRQIQLGETYAFNGANLIGLLARYQHPLYENSREREKFDHIERFVQRLLHLPNAKLEVTHDHSQIMLSNNDLRLPLSSYGTGVHELIILVTAVLSVDNAICGIEEPEIHLHPSLQREFIQFISQETSNTYLLSTHSPAMINIQSKLPVEIRNTIQIFYLSDNGTGTIGIPVLQDEHSIAALNDLGVTASDILQANCIIWVEGPSDRIYLNHWIRLLDETLVEGLHYSVMFYGGKLASHLSLSRNQRAIDTKVPDELIDILRINQRSIVVMDRDYRNAKAEINETKKRIRDECISSGGIAWITHGREIENYLPTSVLTSTCKEILKFDLQVKIGAFDKFEEKLDRTLEQAGVSPIRYATKKVELARQFIRHFNHNDFSPELQSTLNEIVNQIRQWSS